MILLIVEKSPIVHKKVVSIRSWTQSHKFRSLEASPLEVCNFDIG